MAMYDNLLANVPTDLWIGGKWRKSSDGGRFDVIDPATENKVASVASATVEDAKAALAASTAALASSTVALATEAILFSVAGSRTSKRPPSEDLRHLPPIQRSVGTLARRFSYMGHFL